MSKWKKWTEERLDRYYNWLADLSQQMKRLEWATKDTISCEKCGCLVLKDNAVEGEPIVKTLIIPYQNLDIVFGIDFHKDHKLHTPYYCKLHAPKTKMATEIEWKPLKSKKEKK